MKNNGCIVNALLTLFFLMIVGMDVLLGWSTFEHARADYFPTTRGVITHSELAYSWGKGRTTGVDIRYTYSVNGQSFSGDTYRWQSGYSSDSQWARDAVARYPVGAQAVVHYDPHNPRFAALNTGIDGADLFLLLFSLPFNAVLLAGVGAMIFKAPDRVGGLQWRTEGSRTVVRLARVSPWVTGVGAAVLAGFVSIFVIALCFGGTHPPITVLLIDWALLAVLGVVAWRAEERKHARGDYDLVIDAATKTVAVPPLDKHSSPRAFAARDLLGATSDREERRSRRGRRYLVGIVTLRHRAGALKLIELIDTDEADALAAALNAALKQIGVGRA